jgi:hypothetical protein
MKKDEVAEYINTIKDPQRFLAYCNKFHESEPRDIAYVVSASIVSKDPGDINFILAGAKIIIMTWNVASYQKLRRDVKLRLEKDIVDAYEESREDLKSFRGRRLENIDLDDNNIKDAIKNIFLNFSTKTSIGSTGASKILHLINPHVFMMWDARIREAYHTLHVGHGLYGKNQKIAECYLEFLKQSQEIIKTLLHNISEDDLWKEHQKSIEKEFFRVFSFRETILKMLDEANYIRFTKGVTII